MAFRHRQLAQALQHRFGQHPRFGDGIATRNGELVKFPASIQPFPTDAELDQWVKEYEALPPDDAAKDPKAAKRKRFDALGNGLQELKDFIRAELL